MMLQTGGNVYVSLLAGLAVALTTSLVAPTIKRRWARQELTQHQDATIQIARMEASDKFQDRLLERIRDLETRTVLTPQPLNDAICGLSIAITVLTAAITETKKK